MKLRDFLKTISIDDVLWYADRDEADRLRDTYETLMAVKPTYGNPDMKITVKEIDGEPAVCNTHLGAVSDVVGYHLAIDKHIELTDEELAVVLLRALSAAIDEENEDAWDDIMNLQKAKIVR